VTDLGKRVRAAVKPAAAAAVATAFGFPLALTVAVMCFLLVQSRLDHRDPKLSDAPLSGADLTVPFSDEADT
jgi:hypothetical protein